ncbi:hypothetical protein OF83DRAFT_432323 [Amylostereum chailletii]|nr:hypothetical protein OF83DRAFT_432323 [Amylostereum chailletii]
MDVSSSGFCTSHTKIASLLTWCDAHGITIDPRIHITPDASGGMLVRARRGCSISTGDSQLSCSRPADALSSTVATIPKSAVLSARSCRLAEDIYALSQLQGGVHGWDVAYGHGAQLVLAMGVYDELLQGPDSTWAQYLDSLPAVDEWDGIGLLWDASRDCPHAPEGAEDMDARDAAQWLKGTEAERLMRDEDGRFLVDDIRTFFDDVVVPLFSRLYSPREPRPPESVPSSKRSGSQHTAAIRAVSSSSSRMQPAWDWHGFCHAAQGRSSWTRSTVLPWSPSQMRKSHGALFICFPDPPIPSTRSRGRRPIIASFVLPLSPFGSRAFPFIMCADELSPPFPPSSYRRSLILSGPSLRSPSSVTTETRSPVWHRPHARCTHPHSEPFPNPPSFRPSHATPCAPPTLVFHVFLPRNLPRIP